MSWPQAFYDGVCVVCWTFIIWRVGAGVLAIWAVKNS
jgi:hypothetical protein